jgi:hypothetical protein
MSFEQQLFPPDWCYSPALINDRFNAAQAKYGRNAVLTDSRFQKAREMWITGTYLLGLEVRTGAFFWAAPEYHDPPDTYGVGVTTHEGRSGLYKVICRFEVTGCHAGRAVPTEEIWLLGPTRTMGLAIEQAIVQIYPVKGAALLFPLREALNFFGGCQPALLRFRRGTKGRIEKSGPVELPLP